MRTMQAILDYQREFFRRRRPVEAAADDPQDIADATGLDVSTISRVVNNKYVQTQFGILSSNSCFPKRCRPTAARKCRRTRSRTSSLSASTKENKRKPLTDETLMDILNDKGYRIARRTVAKYREMLGFRSPGCAAVVGGRRTARAGCGILPSGVPFPDICAIFVSENRESHGIFRMEPFEPRYFGADASLSSFRRGRYY